MKWWHNTTSLKGQRAHVPQAVADNNSIPSQVPYYHFFTFNPSFLVHRIRSCKPQDVPAPTSPRPPTLSLKFNMSQSSSRLKWPMEFPVMLEAQQGTVVQAHKSQEPLATFGHLAVASNPQRCVQLQQDKDPTHVPQHHSHQITATDSLKAKYSKMRNQPPHHKTVPTTTVPTEPHWTLTDTLKIKHRSPPPHHTTLEATKSPFRSKTVGHHQPLRPPQIFSVNTR